MRQIHVSKPDHPRCGRLDHRNPVTRRINNGLAQPGLWQRLPLMLVICHQPGRRGLGACEDRSNELIAQRPGEGELRDRQILRPMKPTLATCTFRTGPPRTSRNERKDLWCGQIDLNCASRVSPVVPVHDLVERPALGPGDRP
jgi:hypothetical protein